MLVPVGVDLRHSVQLVFPAAATLPVVSAWLRRRLDEERYALELEAPCDLAVPDARVVIMGGPFGDTRLLGVIEASQGVRVTVLQTLAHTAEDRKSPRTAGRLDVRWRLVRPGEPDQPRRWLEEGFSLAPVGDWSTPELEMDVSIAGLRFRDDTPCAVGAVLLVELGNPDEAERHRCSGIVRRLLDGPEGREIAVELADLSEDGEDVLVDVLLDAE